MSDTSFASLCPTLLARKGGAKPAMRPQLGVQPKIDGQVAEGTTEDDLGWNDMGDFADEGGTLANVVPLSAEQSVAYDVDTVISDESRLMERRLPQNNVVRDRIDQIASTFETPVRQSKKSTKRAAKTVSKADDGGKRAAFTLRLDAERHLRLRLASTIRNCSAQQFVTEALDAMLENMPEIDGLAAQVQRS